MSAEVQRTGRSGFTLIELLVVIAIIAILIGLPVPAVQKVREAAFHTKCVNNLKQMGLAMNTYYDTNNKFPTGTYEGITWMVELLPYIEEGNAYKVYFPNGYNSGPVEDSSGNNVIMPLFLCPSEPRGTDGGSWTPGQSGGYGLTDYVGITGVDLDSTGAQQGVINNSEKFIRLGHIIDGTSNTAVIAERPFSPDFYWGWWDFPSCCDTLSGARMTNESIFSSECSAQYAPPFNYGNGPNNVNNYCSMNYLWGPHPGTSNMAFADGSVHSITYSTSPLVVAHLATYAGGETFVLEF